MDVDAFVLAHRPTWQRLEELVKRRRRLTGAEVDELVELYQRVSTHLSMVRTASSDSVLVGRLSSLVARARSAVTSAHAPLWSEFIRFWTVSFPVVAYRCWRWWAATALVFFAVTVIIALWVAGNPEVQATVGTPSEIDQLVNHEFADYYSEHPAGSFALQVWTNNSWVAARCIAIRAAARHPHSVSAVSERRQPRSDRGPDVQRREGRHHARPPRPARVDRADRGVPGGRGGHAAGLVGDLAGQSARACRCWPSGAGRWCPSRSDWSSCCWSPG